jgi:tetratricopeptide (TPR) repeat protein
MAFTLSVPGQDKKEKKRAKDLADQAEKQFRQKDYRGAADLYGQSILIVPTNPSAHYFKGYAHFSLNEFDQALNELGIALSQGYKPIEVYRLRSYIYFVQKNFDLALADIDKGIGIDPNNLALLKALGEIQYSRGAFADALNTFQKIRSVAPKDGDNYYNIARVQQALGNSKEQAEAAEAAIRLGASLLGESYFLLGDARQKQKNILEAIQAYQRSVATKKDYYPAYDSLGDILRRESRYSEAVDVYKKALASFPDDGHFYMDLSRNLSLAGRNQEAAEAAQAAIRIVPGQYMAFTHLCRASNDLKQFQQAIAACNSALKLSPKDGETYFYLARAYDLSGRKSDATSLYAKAVSGLIQTTRSNPNDPDGFYLLGNAYFTDGQLDKAIDAYGKCILLNPHFAKARLNLGLTFIRKRDKAGASEQYEALRELDLTKADQLKKEIDKL